MSEANTMVLTEAERSSGEVQRLFRELDKPSLKHIQDERASA